jgi:hypothetical protein
VFAWGGVVGAWAWYCGVWVRVWLHLNYWLASGLENRMGTGLATKRQNRRSYMHSEARAIIRSGVIAKMDALHMHDGKLMSRSM